MSTKRSCGLLILLLCLAWAGPARAAKVTVDDLIRLRSVSEVQVSPDGKRVAYVVSTPSLERAAHEAVLYVVDSAGGEPLRLTYGTRIFNQPLPSPELRWSPDGSYLTFVGFVGEVPQVLALSAAGGEPRPLTTFKDGVTRYELSPDGKRIAFQTSDPASADEEKRKKEKSYVIEVDRHERWPRIWVQDLDGGEPRAITPPSQFVVDFSWAPDGQSVVYAASTVGGFYAQYNSRIYTLAVAGGEPHPRVDRAGMNRMPQYSPDGRWIAFVSSGGAEGLVTPKDLHVMAAEGRPESIKNLTAAREAWVMELAWAPDSRSLFFVSGEQAGQTGEKMFEQPIERVWLDTGQLESVTPAGTVNYSLSLSANGKSLAYKSVEKRTMGDVVVLDLASKETRRLTEINPELRSLELGELRAIHWNSFDGKEIWGLLLTPPGYQRGTRIPLVVYCHGGPIGGFTYGIFPQFAHIPGQVDPYPSEAMASAGMAILFPMPRGGSGYGVAGWRAILNRWGEDDYKDILAGVDHLIAEGMADPERLGVMGASYGGFMTSWIVTQTNRFKAASTGASVNDLAQMFYLSDAGDVMVEYFGYPWEATASLVEHSPITHAAQVTTPLLIQHGENDRRVPLEQAKAFYKALKTLRKAVELEIYPRGGHVNFEPPLEREYMRRNLEWFVRWLKP